MCVGVCGWVLEATEGEAAAGVVRQREFRGHSLYFFVGMSLREAAKQTRKCRSRRKNKQREESRTHSEGAKREKFHQGHDERFTKVYLFFQNEVFQKCYELQH